MSLLSLLSDNSALAPEKFTFSLHWLMLLGSGILSKSLIRCVGKLAWCFFSTLSRVGVRRWHFTCHLGPGSLAPIQIPPLSAHLGPNHTTRTALRLVGVGH
eukprot:g65473.t1